jgi:cytochrome c biogenesis protein CcmG, thiol:disulfide interchange protein DsbE
MNSPLRRRGSRVFLLGFAIAVSAHTAPAVDVGQPAPALVVPRVDGESFDLKQARGKVVVVNFWATWCEPCRQETPVLDAFYKAHHGDGLELVGLSMNRPRERGDVQKAMQSVTYPVAIAAEATSNGFGAVRVLPMTYVIDREGIVRARLSAGEALTARQLDDVVLPLLRAAGSTSTQ